MTTTLQRLFRHKAWADDAWLNALAGLDAGSPVTGLALRALSHSHVVDRIFAAHLRKEPHAYTSANMAEMPSTQSPNTSFQERRNQTWRRRRCGVSPTLTVRRRSLIAGISSSTLLRANRRKFAMERYWDSQP